MNRPTKRARTPRGNPPPNTVAADPSQWSEQSQGSVSASWTHSYTDVTYFCRRCQTKTLFSAPDQKYTYEVKKAPIDQQRSLCQPCWSESHQIARALKGLEAQWAQSKPSLRTDKEFLRHTSPPARVRSQRAGPSGARPDPFLFILDR